MGSRCKRRGFGRAVQPATPNRPSGRVEAGLATTLDIHGLLDYVSCEAVDEAFLR